MTCILLQTSSFVTGSFVCGIQKHLIHIASQLRACILLSSSAISVWLCHTYRKVNKISVCISLVIGEAGDRMTDLHMT